MNSYYVKTINKPVYIDSLTLPGSKSISNRALLLSALAMKRMKLYNLLICDDTNYMMNALKDCNTTIIEKDGYYEIINKNFPLGNKYFFLGNAGTTVRFLTTYLTLGKGHFVVDGDERMRNRPIQDLVEALKELGADIICKTGCPPLEINANGLNGGVIDIYGGKSSQYVSSILMCAPYFKGETMIKVKDKTSEPYIDMTINMMKQFGWNVIRDLDFYVVKNNYNIEIDEYYIEPDASSLSYFITACAILGGRVKINGLGKNSLQGDINYLNVLKEMGCNVIFNDSEIIFESDGNLKAAKVDIKDIPDMAPSLAIAALFAEGETIVYNGENLRIKECDRINAIVENIIKLGGEAYQQKDGFIIKGKKKYHGAKINTYNDHRIAMSFAIAGLKIDGIEIENYHCVNKSFPEFFIYFERLFYQ